MEHHSSWTRIASKNVTMISVDLPWVFFGSGYPSHKGITYEFFREENKGLYQLEVDSHKIETLKKVERI